MIGGSIGGGVAAARFAAQAPKLLGGVAGAGAVLGLAGYGGYRAYKALRKK